MQNAMIIDPKDNVAVAIEPIAAGDTVTYLKDHDGRRLLHTKLQGVPVYCWGKVS